VKGIRTRKKIDLVGAVTFGPFRPLRLRHERDRTPIRKVEYGTNGLVLNIRDAGQNVEIQNTSAAEKAHLYPVRCVILG
jgi:hypothetical protein